MRKIKRPRPPRRKKPGRRAFIRRERAESVRLSIERRP